MKASWCCLALISLCCFHGVIAFGQSSPKTVHVFVALADNKNQGIVPVAAKLGNGEDAEHNLYWGAAYGVKTFFARSRDWERLTCVPRPKPEILERCIFKHRKQNVFLVADAYRGIQIRQAVIDFLDAAAGTAPERVSVQVGPQGFSLAAGGGANLVAYVGHEGFMDFQLPTLPSGKDSAPRPAIVLACLSKSYFAEALHAAGAQPLVWTTGLMAPEAYTLKSAIDGWMLGESGEQIRERAAAAYDQYQKCGLRAARRLLVTGW
jgi:hypothetical protein